MQLRQWQQLQQLQQRSAQDDMKQLLSYSIMMEQFWIVSTHHLVTLLRKARENTCDFPRVAQCRSSTQHRAIGSGMPAPHLHQCCIVHDRIPHVACVGGVASVHVAWA